MDTLINKEVLYSIEPTILRDYVEKNERIKNKNKIANLIENILGSITLVLLFITLFNVISSIN